MAPNYGIPIQAETMVLASATSLTKTIHILKEEKDRYRDLLVECQRCLVANGILNLKYGGEDILNKIAEAIATQSNI